MPGVPYLATAIRGWTQKRQVELVTQTVVSHVPTESRVTTQLDINIQPTPAQEVIRRPEDQRSWKYWTLIVREGPVLDIDDVAVVESISYRITHVHNWSESGFQKYQAIEDYGT